MNARYTIVIVALLASGSAFAESLDAEAALRFVVDKLFAFTCFDGSRGTGRFYGDGSVIGTVQLRGSGPVRSLWRPAGTLKFKGETVCASLNDMSFEPCFDLSRIDDQSFRGSVLGMDFAYCDFAHLLSSTAQPSDPLSLDPQDGNKTRLLEASPGAR
jgi:hypothetical protein